MARQGGGVGGALGTAIMAVLSPVIMLWMVVAQIISAREGIDLSSASPNALGIASGIFSSLGFLFVFRKDGGRYLGWYCFAAGGFGLLVWFLLFSGVFVSVPT